MTITEQIQKDIDEILNGKLNRYPYPLIYKPTVTNETIVEVRDYIEKLPDYVTVRLCDVFVNFYPLGDYFRAELEIEILDRFEANQLF